VAKSGMPDLAGAPQHEGFDGFRHIALILRSLP
jgi:hypothetical protein